MLLLNEAAIREFFTLQDAVEAVKKAFSLFSDGRIQVPLRTRINASGRDGTFLCMPAYCEEEAAACVKVLNIFKGNADIGLPTLTAWILVMDAETGEINGLVDGTFVTKLRTGAASGAAFELLARETCAKGALIGTGGQAATQLEAMLAARELAEVQLCGRDFERAERFAAAMRERLSRYGTRITAVRQADAAVADADLIVTVTPSEAPVFNAGMIKPGATLSCVGSYQPHMRELDPGALARASKIYFDSGEAVLSEAGDIIIPLADGTITGEKFSGDLGQLINGTITGRGNDEEIIIFKTVGIAAQDLITAKAIYDKALKGGFGFHWT